MTDNDKSSPSKGVVLFVDDEPGMRRMASRALEREGYRVETAQDGESALKLFDGQKFDLVITDIVMEPMSGLTLLEKIKERDPGLPVVMVTAYGTVENAVSAMKRGASDYVAKPFSVDELTHVVAKVMERERLLEEREYLREEIARHYDFQGIVGSSPIMRRVFDISATVSKTNSSVLISGESGTGKELIARSIHFSGPRKNGPFVVLNCGALPEGVLESELFGHEKGAFTGAIRQRKGRFELAHGGSLFIDEVGELTPNSQLRLLRVLQEREFERVGGDETISVDVRIISATNKNLRKEVEEGRFREDLYYRLNVVEIPVPPLRERAEDILPLAKFFLTRYVRETGKNITSISPLAQEVLTRYSWPGNVRELENAMERAVVLCQGQSIIPGDLPVGMGGERKSVLEIPGEKKNIQEILEDLERQIILKTLEENANSQSKTAQQLGIARTTLRYKLEKYGLLAT